MLGFIQAWGQDFFFRGAQVGKIEFFYIFMRKIWRTFKFFDLKIFHLKYFYLYLGARENLGISDEKETFWLIFLFYLTRIWTKYSPAVPNKFHSNSTLQIPIKSNKNAFKITYIIFYCKMFCKFILITNIIRGEIIIRNQLNLVIEPVGLMING